MAAIVCPRSAWEGRSATGNFSGMVSPHAVAHYTEAKRRICDEAIFVAGLFQSYIGLDAMCGVVAHVVLVSSSGEALKAGSKILGEMTGTAVTVWWVLLEGTVYDFLAHRREILPILGQFRMRIVRDGEEQRRQGVGCKGRLSGQKLEQHDAERENVRPPVHFFPRNLLRGHVRRRA